MGGGGAGPPANRGPRVVRRAYKACYFWHFFSFSADYAVELHRGCRGRVLLLPGLLWNETRAPRTWETLVHCRCVSAEGKEWVPLPCGVEVVRLSRRVKSGDAWVGAGRDLDWHLSHSGVKMIGGSRRPAVGISFLGRDSGGGWDWPLESRVRLCWVSRASWTPRVSGSICSFIPSAHL